MTTKEILKKVRKIEIKARGLSSHIFSGEYHSAFKGRGMSFAEVREYSPGDDVRTIDWNVTARLSSPYVKTFEEERELTVILMIDISNSTIFGSAARSKREMATELAAVLAFSATTNNDKVGVIFFSDKVEHYIPPQKGKSHVLRIIRELIARQPQPGSRTDLSCALEFLNNVMRKRCTTFLVSDMIAPPYQKPLQMAARKHDLTGIQIYDLLDASLPDVGLLEVQDAEMNRSLVIDTSDRHTRRDYAATFLRHCKYSKDTFVKSGAQLMAIRTDQDYVKALQGFFRSRI